MIRMFGVRIDDARNTSALLIAAGEQPGASRTANDSARLKVRDPYSLFRHSFELRSFNPTAIGARIAVTHVIGENDDDVWWRFG